MREFIGYPIEFVLSKLEGEDIEIIFNTENKDNISNLANGLSDNVCSADKKDNICNIKKDSKCVCGARLEKERSNLFVTNAIKEGGKYYITVSKFKIEVE